MRTIIPLKTIIGPYVPEGDTQFAQTDSTTADLVNGNVVKMASNEIVLLVSNVGVSNQTVTIQSSADPFGRTADITNFTVTAGDTFCRRFIATGWEQTLGVGDLFIDASSTDIMYLAFLV